MPNETLKPVELGTTPESVITGKQSVPMDANTSPEKALPSLKITEPVHEDLSAKLVAELAERNKSSDITNSLYKRTFGDLDRERVRINVLEKQLNKITIRMNPD